MTDSIYNNVACIIVSQDENSEAWIHLGVELRGQEINRAPHLSTFGGAIDIHDGKKEDVIAALQREVREESLGLLNDEITFEKLTNPNLCYSFVYTNPVDMSTTVVCAIMVDHQIMQKIKELFDKERHERLFQQNGKKFNTRSETEVKQIRSVKLDDLKAHLQANTPVLCAEMPSRFFSLDGNSLKLDAQKNLIAYQVLCEGNNLVESIIPCALPLRYEIAESLKKMLPSLEYRFLNTAIIADQDLATGFYGKSLRADEFSFIEEFIATTPIKGLTPNGFNEPKPAKRKGKRSRATSRGSEIIDVDLKKTHSIAKQYTEEQKSNYSNAQSISYFAVPQGTPVFGWTKERSVRLLGVAGLDMLPNRLFIYDGGTVNRPYDGNNLIQLKKYIQKKTTGTDAIMFDISELELFKEAVKSIGDRQYNEILGRIRWDIEQTSICVFSDNIETRWIAINWASKFIRKIKEKSFDLYQKEKITKSECEKFHQYQPKISYYNFTTRASGYYSHDQLKSDIDAANRLYDNLIEREKHYSNKDFEFLLMIDDINKLSEIIHNKALMTTIMCERLYIAEELIEKYYKITNQPVIIDDQNLDLNNVTPSLLDKLNSGIISGFKTGADGRILLDGLTIADKDLSHMNLTRFNFNNAELTQCVLKNVKLVIKSNEKVVFEKCDLRGSNLENCDMSNVTLSDYYLCDDKEPNPQIWKNDVNFHVYSNHFNPNEIIECLKNEVITKNMLHFAFKLFLVKNNAEGLKLLMTQCSVELLDEMSSNFSWIGDNALTFAIEKKNIELAKWIIEKNPKIALDVITYGYYKGHNALTLAVDKKNIELAKCIIEKNPKSALHVITDGIWKGHNALTLAIEHSNPELAKLIIEQYPELVEYVITEEGGYKNCTPLGLASWDHNNQELMVLIKQTLLNNEFKRAQALAENEHNQKQQTAFKSVDVYLPSFTSAPFTDVTMEKVEEENKNNKRKRSSSSEDDAALRDAKRPKK